MLEIGGVRVDTLAQTYKTPLFVYDEDQLRSRLQEYATFFQSDTMETGVLYASKAFSCKAMLRLVKEYGLSLDVVSGGELYTAKAVDFDMSKVYFHGNNKSKEELEMAINYGVGTIIVDNLMEAQMLHEMSQSIDHTIHVLLRVNPGIDAHTHKYIVTGHVDSKFGISLLQEKELVDVIRTFDQDEHLSFDGLHAHIGSQIFDKNAFIAEIEKMFGFIKHLEDTYDIHLNTLDLGGGFAATYTSEDHPIPLQEVCSTIVSHCEKQNQELGLSIQKILIEPGRSVVAEAGSTIYTVGFMKQTPNKKYVFVDGGMADNIRPALYQAKYNADIANKMDAPKDTVYTVAGKACESGDILIEGIALPKCEPGDLLVTYTTGAYGYAMASHYNKNPLPGVVFCRQGKAREVIRRESYEHLIDLEKDE